MLLLALRSRRRFFRRPVQAAPIPHRRTRKKPDWEPSPWALDLTFLAADKPPVLGAWYNHVRPHQSLDGITPAMAWAGATRSSRAPRLFRAWDGILTGVATPT